MRTGLPAFPHVFGQPYFDYMAEHAEDAGHWNRAMEQTARDLLAALPDVYDFRPFAMVVDVGGGYGHVLAAALRTAPHLRGVLLDRPEVVAGAAGCLRKPA